MFQKKFNLIFLTDNFIKEYMEQSETFDIERKKYEQRIVEWQINWMNSDGENWITDEKYGGDFVFLTPVCDLGFRKGIVDTLLKIGMSIDAIEAGIEKNADKWRDNYMNCAFTNEYEPIFLNIDIDSCFEDESNQKHEIKKLEPADLEFKEKWLKMRKYEYYQRHKSSVDKYGIIEPDMKLSDEEVSELKVYLEQKHNERKLRIEQYQQERNNIKAHQRVLKMSINN